MASFTSYEDFLYKNNLTEIVDRIKENIQQYYDDSRSYQKGIGFIIETPIKIGTIGKHDLFINGVHLGNYDIDNEVLFDVFWNRKQVDDCTIISYEYDTYFLSVYDAYKGQLAQTYNGYKDLTLSIDTNYLDKIEAELSNMNNINLTIHINKLYHENNKKENGLNGFKTRREYDYYRYRYDKMCDYSYYQKEWETVKDFNETDYKKYLDEQNRLYEQNKNMIDDIFEKNN
jgi:hypothetical protein